MGLRALREQCLLITALGIQQSVRVTTYSSSFCFENYILFLGFLSCEEEKKLECYYYGLANIKYETYEGNQCNHCILLRSIVCSRVLLLTNCLNFITSGRVTKCNKIMLINEGFGAGILTNSYITSSTLPFVVALP